MPSAAAAIAISKMSAAKPAYPLLQRHRRKSSQPSPTSPSFPRRFLDRPSRVVDPFSPVEGSSAGTGRSDSPSLDVDVPSPILDIPASSHALQDVTQTYKGEGQALRISENDGRLRPQVLPSVTRPFTSDAMDTKHGLHVGPANGFSYDHNFRVSPNMSNTRFGEYNERLSSEGSGRYADNHSPNLRTFGPSSQTLDKAFQDEQGPTKLNAGKKSRLNLLNPMSLLARRRTSQNHNESSNMNVHTMHVPALPDNFDPSIRGTITHDFSAPRTRRNHSYGGDGGQSDPSRRDYLSPGQPSPFEKTTPKLPPPSGPTPTHSPMFKEHFQDDRQPLRPGQTGYLHNISTQSSTVPGDLAASMPAFAKKLPVRLPDQDRLDVSAENADLDRPPPKPPSHPPPTPPAETPPKPTEPPPPPPKRTPSPVSNLPPASVLPKHMTSTSSRFSFQLGSQASSAQEKLLEEKHKHFNTGNRISSISKKDDPDEDNYDDYDFEADDGLEENIPMAGFEDDFDEDANFINSVEGPAHDLAAMKALASVQPQSMQGFHFTPQSLIYSPTSTNHASQPTPRDDQGLPIGVAGSRESQEYLQRSTNDEHYSSSKQDTLAFFDGLGITTDVKADSLQPTPQQQKEAFDDDLYFDDGEFDHDFGPGPESFDEDMFDDESKIRDIPAENLRKYEAALEAAGPNGGVKVITSRSSAGSSIKPVEPNHSQKDQSTLPGLTETNLAAYHDALANAANEAAANGKFRNVSFSQVSDDETSHSQSQVGRVSDESRYSSNLNQHHSTIAEDDGFPFDDDGDDDMMIAEANAEALENDDEGFYGREFGFYARARGKDPGAEMVNGGFFATRGSNGVKRSHSGKANFQEPSLTPITERSEWSTRNSVANLQIPPGFGIPGSANSLPSPGIAQLLELDSAGSGYGDDSDMTLSALLKLRRGTFGGSSTSVNSQGGGHAGGSPLGHTYGPFSPQDHGHSRMMGSMHSLQSAGIPESEEEEDEGFDEPTLTQNTPMKKAVEPAQAPTTPLEQPILSAISASGGSSDTGKGRKSHHRRNSSGAESVSYARDSDGRWVLERRRTGDDGGTEIEREFVGAGMI